MSILVTGATGAVGRHVINGLLARGVAVRALSRKPGEADLLAGKEVVQGDLSSGDFARGLFDGISRVFVFPVAGGVDAFVERAAEAGIEHFVVLSSLAAANEFERDHGSASSVHHLAIEAAVASTGIDMTIIRPGTFANNLLSWAYPIKAFGAVEGPYASSAQAPIHEADVADVVVAALTDDSHRGKVHPITGPEALTRVQQLDAIGAAIGRELKFNEVSPEQFRASMSNSIPADIMKMLLDYWSDTTTTPDVVRSVEPITGRPGRTLRDWAVDHANDFR